LLDELQKQLAAKDAAITDLQNRLAAVDLGEESPAGFGDGTTQEKQQARTLRDGFQNKIRMSGSTARNN